MFHVQLTTFIFMISLSLSPSLSVAVSARTVAPSPTASLLPTSSPLHLPIHKVSSDEIELHTKVEGALSNEVGLILLSVLDTFTSNFKVGVRVYVSECVCEGAHAYQSKC